MCVWVGRRQPKHRPRGYEPSQNLVEVKVGGLAAVQIHTSEAIGNEATSAAA